MSDPANEVVPEEVVVPSVNVDGVDTLVSALPPQVQQQLVLLEHWKTDVQKLQEAAATSLKNMQDLVSEHKMNVLKMECAVAHLSTQIVLAIREARKPVDVPVVDVPVVDVPVVDDVVE